MESRFVDLGGVRLNYGEGAANGPKLVFLHGFPGAWTEHAPVYALLEPHYHLFAPTFRGLGRSQRAERYPIPGWIVDTAAFVRRVVGVPALGVGHSAGAWFGLAAAATDPRLFSAFVSLDQPLDPQVHIRYQSKRVAMITAMAAAMRAAADVDDLSSRLATVPTPSGGTWGEVLSEAQLAQEAEGLRAHDPEVFAAWVEDALEAWIAIPELQAWPGAYRNPLLFLDGDPDAGALVDGEGARYNLARYPWAERVELADLDHGLGLWDAPAPVVAEIRRFFEGPARRRR